MQLRLRQVPPFFENNILAILIDRAARAQTTVSSCSVFIAQCIMVHISHCYHPLYSPKSSKIYRCWIVWGQNIRVVIIPSLLVITYLCQLIYLHLISRFQFITSRYLASELCNITAGILLYSRCNKLRHGHVRECLGDGFDRVQDPQGVLGS